MNYTRLTLYTSLKKYHNEPQNRMIRLGRWREIQACILLFTLLYYNHWKNLLYPTWLGNQRNCLCTRLLNLLTPSPWTHPTWSATLLSPPHLLHCLSPTLPSPLHSQQLMYSYWIGELFAFLSQDYSDLGFAETTEIFEFQHCSTSIDSPLGNSMYG